MSVFGYVRVSTVRQVDDGESLDVQQRQLQGYAHMHDLTLSEIAVEKGVSGSIPVEERLVGAMLAQLTEPDVQQIIKAIAATGADPFWVMEAIALEQDAAKATAAAAPAAPIGRKHWPGCPAGCSGRTSVPRNPTCLPSPSK
jgi:hypothetical protein